MTIEERKLICEVHRRKYNLSVFTGINCVNEQCFRDCPLIEVMRKDILGDK
jgi:hypothetical protein